MIKITKKRAGAIVAVAEHLNSILEKDQTKWSGFFEDNFFIIKREFYHEKIEKKLSSKFMQNEVLIKKMSIYNKIAKNFNQTCIITEGEKTL